MKDSLHLVASTLAAVDLTMGMSVTQPLEVRWDAPPDAVGSALARAIADGRYDDAGDPTVVGWRATGAVDDRAVDIRMTTIGAPGGPGAGIEMAVRGELLPDGGGTRLKAAASLPRRRWESAVVAGFLVLLAGIAAIGLGSEAGLPVIAAIFAAVLAFNWVVMTVVNGRVNGSVLQATPQAEVALRSLGTPRAGD